MASLSSKRVNAPTKPTPVVLPNEDSDSVPDSQPDPDLVASPKDSDGDEDTQQSGVFGLGESKWFSDNIGEVKEGRSEPLIIGITFPTHTAMNYKDIMARLCEIDNDYSKCRDEEEVCFVYRARHCKAQSTQPKRDT